MLLGNYNIFNNNPGRAIGGPTDPAKWMKSGTAHNYYTGEHVVSGETDKSGFNTGYLPPYSWILPPKSGGISSHRSAIINFVSTPSLAGGKPGVGAATITFSQTDTGLLVVSGSGSATITFSSVASILAALSVIGSATITLSGTAELLAKAYLAGNTTITLSPTAIRYAIGYMSGLSTSETEFSAAALAQAVWDAATAAYANPGSFGQAMAAAGSAGDPWSTNIPGAYVAGQAGYLVGNQVLTEDDITKIADIILRRATSSVEASASGDALSVRSLYGMIAQGTHKTSIAGATLTITKSNESTTLGTRTITTSATAEPITGLDTD